MAPISDSFDFDEDLAISLLGYWSINRKRKTQKKKPRFWVNDYLKDRRTKGRYYVDMNMARNPRVFRENFRMSPELFQILHRLLYPSLTPKTTKIRSDHISTEEKLAVTLEYLASGDLLRHLASSYRISKQRLGEIIEETCDCIVQCLQKEYLPQIGPAFWKNSADQFYSKWNLPNCLGSIDGKHCAIKCPNNSGTAFYNYKGYFSLVLMAVADADYKFIYYDVGAYGSEGDSGVFRECEFGTALRNGDLKLPYCNSVDGKSLPYYFGADDAFPLDKHILKPYKPSKLQPNLSHNERIFNYRLSRGRRTVENTFGILCVRWMCLARTLWIGPNRAQKVIAACCLLHNFMMTTGKDEYAPTGFSDFETADGEMVNGYWRDKILPSSLFHSNLDFMLSGRSSQIAKDTRDYLANYFVTNNGRVNWQDNAIFKRN